MASSKKIRLLIVDDEPEFAELLSIQLEDRPFMVDAAHSLREGRQHLAAQSYDVLLLDLGLPDGSGLELLAEVKRDTPAMKVIVISGTATTERAVQAMKQGANDFLAKPFTGESVTRLLDILVGPSSETARSAGALVGRSPAMNRVQETIQKFAPSDLTMLLLGESGTGKEVAARAIHARSLRADGPFVDLDCAAVPQMLLESELFGHERGAFTDARDRRLGRFELAESGTLFLDEIGNLSLEGQAKLLRVLQERSFRRLGGSRLIPCNVRVLAATNLDLEAAVARGAFRQDLYFRLAEMTVRLPPLREREGDVALLVEHFIVEFNARYVKSIQGVSPEAQLLLDAYPWPGNVRELQSVVRSALLQADHYIETRHLPERIWRWSGGAQVSSSVDGEAKNGDITFQVDWPAQGEQFDLKAFIRDAKRELERTVISGIVERHGYNKSQLSRCLGLDFKVLRGKLEELGIDVTRKPRE